jgi:hypothetical protein
LNTSLTVQGQTIKRDSTISKVDSVLNQAIKDAITSDLRLGIITEKNVQLDLKERLLSDIRIRYLSEIRNSDTTKIELVFLHEKLKRRTNKIKILFCLNVATAYYIIRNI